MMLYVVRSFTHENRVVPEAPEAAIAVDAKQRSKGMRGVVMVDVKAGRIWLLATQRAQSLLSQYEVDILPSIDAVRTYAVSVVVLPGIAPHAGRSSVAVLNPERSRATTFRAEWFTKHT
ncbi:MAG: hypothetical protein WA742_09165 [Candidatus Cybelea sp.]